jgi:hypothetical protein
VYSSQQPKNGAFSSLFAVTAQKCAKFGATAGKMTGVEHHVAGTVAVPDGCTMNVKDFT